MKSEQAIKQGQLLMNISRAWNDHQTAIRERWSFERTVKSLRDIIANPGSKMLEVRATKLLNEIVATTKSPKIPGDSHATQKTIK